MVDLWPLEFVASFVASVNLYSFVIGKDLLQCLEKDCVVLLARHKRTIDPHNEARLDANTNLVFQARAVELDAVPLCIEWPRLVDGAIVSINGHQADCRSVPLSKPILQLDDLRFEIGNLFNEVPRPLSKRLWINPSDNATVHFFR